MLPIFFLAMEYGLNQDRNDVVPMEAITHMKAIGLIWYCIVSRPYKRDELQSNEKVLNIAHFKEVFSSHINLQVHTVRII